MSATPTRRQVVKTAVWTVPVVAGVGAIPEYAAASGESAAVTATGSCKHAGTFGKSPRDQDIYKYHLTIRCVSTYGTNMNFVISGPGSVQTGGTPAVNYTPGSLVVPPGTSDLILEAFFDVVASDPIVVVGFLDGVSHTLTFTDFDACGFSD